MIDALASLSPSGVDGAARISRTQAAQPGAAAAGADFGAVMAEVARDSLQTMRGGEAAAVAGLQGQASVQQVVSAVMSAEQTLQTALAVRDKVVAAYQEISRMAI